ncbi:hypothetical protein ABH922_005314 [Rhodococcus sp. 27YEA15]
MNTASRKMRQNDITVELLRDIHSRTQKENRRINVEMNRSGSDGDLLGHVSSVSMDPYLHPQQRFGIVRWQSDHARLEMTLSSGQPAFIPRYVEAKPPVVGRRRRRDFPADRREPVIATAWRLVEEGQSVLIFCPQRRGVTPYAERIVKLHQQGLIGTILAPVPISPTPAQWALNGSERTTPFSNA